MNGKTLEKLGEFGRSYRRLWAGGKGRKTAQIDEADLVLPSSLISKWAITVESRISVRYYVYQSSRPFKRDKKEIFLYKAVDFSAPSPS